MMKQIIKCLLEIIENPSVKKPYNNLKKCYEMLDKKNEAQALAKLIEHKFGPPDEP